MAAKKSHGGPRKGAGRKPVDDPKIQVSLYIEESIIKAMGGVEELRNDCYSYLKKKVLKINDLQILFDLVLKPGNAKVIVMFLVHN